MVLLCVFLFLVFSGCTKYKEEPPFFDGLYLKYYEVFSKSEKPEDIIWTREIEYRFEKLKNGDFHISQMVNTQRGKRLDKKLDPPPYPQVGDDLTIDKNGIVLKGGDNFNFPEGYPSYLWLPSDKREKGAEMIKMIWKVEEKRKWEGIEVLPVKGMLGNIRYYDVATGILVGTENINGKLKMILVDTNHAGLKAVLPE
jgi:hypothetical protein